MKDKKNQKLDYFSENLAFPEVHVGTPAQTEDEDAGSESGGGDMVFDNLAVPEIKVSHSPRQPKKDK